MQGTRKLLLATACIPILYMIHRVLLEFYSAILIKPQYNICKVVPDARPLEEERPFRPEDCPLIDAADFRPPETTTVAAPLPSASFYKTSKFGAPIETGRESDVIDTFEKYEHASECELSSLDIHMPFSPLCPDKKSVMTAMSGGGRPGYDMPYIPLGCDMRWYSTDEACQIVSRFKHIAFIGDSLMRHVVNAMYVILRQDIGYGGITDWDLDFTEADDITQPTDCICSAQTGKHVCSDAVIARTEWIEGNKTIAPNARPLACDPDLGVDISFTRSNSYPATQDELEEMKGHLPERSFENSEEPYAFILHSTFWNNVNTSATVLWVDQISKELSEHVAALSNFRPTIEWLFTTANAGGLAKNAQYMEAQGNQQLGNFEKSITPTLEEKGVDVLGFFNMSLQSLTSDGTHASFSANLLKAQMTLNWLDHLNP